jgi:hypothetical protein
VNAVGSWEQHWPSDQTPEWFEPAIKAGGASPATIQPLRFGRGNGLPLATEAETLMRGYGTAQRIIDEMITAR